MTLYYTTIQSYWDWLPPEIQEYVIQLATAQYTRDHKTRHKKLWTEVCKEILIYAELKSLWGNHIKFKIEPGHLKGNTDANLEANINDCYGRQRHLVIFGRHVVMSPDHHVIRTEEDFISFGIDKPIM